MNNNVKHPTIDSMDSNEFSIVYATSPQHKTESTKSSDEVEQIEIEINSATKNQPQKPTINNSDNTTDRNGKTNTMYHENEIVSKTTTFVTPNTNSIGGLLNPLDTAILFIEYQNDFVHENGALYAAVEPELKRQNMLNNSKQLLDYARKHNIHIIHAPITYCAEYEKNANRYGVLYNVATNSAFGNKRWGADFLTTMQPQANESIVKGKHGLDTFAGTNLDDILQKFGIANLAICGLLTNCCVESTMRTGYEYGYNIITIHDCCGATSQQEHENSLGHTFKMFSIPVTCVEFMNACIMSEDNDKILPPSSVMHSRQKHEYMKLTQDIAELMISRLVSLVVIIQLLITSNENDQNIMIEIMCLFITAILDIIATFVLFFIWCYCYDRSKYTNADSCFPNSCRTKRVANVKNIFAKFQKIVSVIDVLKIVICVIIGIKSFSTTATQQNKSMISSLIFTFIIGMFELIHIIYTAITKM